ncbi:hypothetical protein BD413DRAFT_530753 [Trametes elegans]|nr:hypothetical protein BD413DRAFT_530753 [Trametes elegans]
MRASAIYYGAGVVATSTRAAQQRFRLFARISGEVSPTSGGRGLGAAPGDCWHAAARASRHCGAAISRWDHEPGRDVTRWVDFGFWQTLRARLHLSIAAPHGRGRMLCRRQTCRKRLSPASSSRLRSRGPPSQVGPRRPKHPPHSSAASLRWPQTSARRLVRRVRVSAHTGFHTSS